MRVVSTFLAVLLLSGFSQAEDDPRFLDAWMKGFLKLQSAHNKEREGQDEEAVRLYSRSLDHYRSMRHYWAEERLAAQLEDRIELLAKKLNSMGVDPFPEYARVPGTSALTPKSEGLVPEVPAVAGVPSRWLLRNDSYLVPLIETPETREYFRERVKPLMELDRYSLLLLSPR